MVGLPLILGIIVYVVIIVALTFWFMRNHSNKCRSLDANVEQDTKDKPVERGVTPANSGKKIQPEK